jgi:cytochrome P450
MAKANQIPPGPTEAFVPSHDLLRWLGDQFERYGDIYQARIYGSSVYVINAPDLIEHVLLKNWQNYIRKGQAVKRIALSLGNGLISSNGPTWVRQRRMIQPAFNRASICGFAGLMQEANAALCARWIRAAESGAAVNVTRDVSHLTLEITLRALFGADYEALAPRFAIVAEESRNLEFAKECNALAKIIMDLAQARRDAGRMDADILGMMIQARDREGGRPMPDVQLAREALTIVIAGHETTASVLNWTWYLIARHPDVESMLSAELDALSAAPVPDVESYAGFPYTRSVIEEALRLYPPLWLMTRRTVHDDWLGDYFVPAGTEIYISPFLVQRHPALWEMPERFEPERFAQEESGRPKLASCPFGAGPRNCIGEFMARLEIQTHLMTVVPQLRLLYPEHRSMEMVPGTNLLSESDFIMNPILRLAARDEKLQGAVSLI